MSTATITGVGRRQRIGGAIGVLWSAWSPTARPMPPSIASPVPPRSSWGWLGITANGQSRPQRHRLDEYGDQERRTRKASVGPTRNAGRHRRPRRVPLLAARRTEHRPALDEQRWPRHVLVNVNDFMNVNDFEVGGPDTPRVRSTVFNRGLCGGDHADRATVPGGHRWDRNRDSGPHPLGSADLTMAAI